MGLGLGVGSLALAEHGGHAVKLIDRDRLCRAIERVAFSTSDHATQPLNVFRLKISPESVDRGGFIGLKNRSSEIRQHFMKRIFIAVEFRIHDPLQHNRMHQVIKHPFLSC